MRRELGSTHHFTHLIRPECEPTPGGDGGILLPQTARAGVARIHRNRLGLATGRDAFGVLGLLGRLESFEGLDREVHLSTHLENLGHGDVLRGFQNFGHHRDRGDVRGDVFADATIAARGRLDESTVLVTKAHRESVDLEFAAIVNRDVAESLQDSLTPGVEFGAIHRVVETRHGNPVLHGSEGLADLTTDQLRG